MNRRELNKTLALGLATSSCLVHSAVSAQKNAPKSDDPASRPFRKVNVKEDFRRVLFFFDFACPYCAQYHQGLMNFQATVPKQIDTLLVPVVNANDNHRKDEMVLAAMFFYAAQELGSREQVKSFIDSVYSMYAKSKSLKDQALWIRAIAASGFAPDAFRRAMSSKTNANLVLFASKKVAQYELRATPSVAVGGRYVITPDDVLGDQTMFFNILNGLTSEIL